MKAVVCQHAELRVDELPEPVPARGQVRLRVLRCGICGSDLHARTGSDDWAAMAERGGYDRFARSDQPVVYGHEFCGEVAEHGPKTRGTVPTGTPTVALPLLRNDGIVDPTGLSQHAPGGYAEQVLVQEPLMLPVPNGLAPEVAALTEPMAVAWHAVRRGEVGKRDVAIVIGCGPVGLGVILMLKAKGVSTVVASDYSPGRRALAKACGADVVVDPASESPYTAAPAKGHIATMPDALDLVVNTREKLERLPVGWWHLWRLGEALGAGPKHPVIFECVGVPGVIDSIIDGAPLSLARRRRRGVRRHRPVHARDGDQQGDRPALRDRLHAARVPRHAAHACRGQGRSVASGHRHGRPRRRRRRVRRPRRSRAARQDPHRSAGELRREAKGRPAGRPSIRVALRALPPRALLRRAARACGRPAGLLGRAGGLLGRLAQGVRGGLQP